MYCIHHLRSGNTDLLHRLHLVSIVVQADVVQALEEVFPAVLDLSQRCLADQRGLVRELRIIFISSKFLCLVLVWECLKQ